MAKAHSVGIAVLEHDETRLLRDRRNGRRRADADIIEVFDLIPGLVVVMDLEHTVLDLNLTAARTAGRSKDECAGRKFWDLFDDPECRAGTCAATRAVATKGLCEGMAYPRIRGKEVPMLVTATPRVDSEGQVFGVVELLLPAEAEVAFSDEMERIAVGVMQGDVHQRMVEEKYHGFHLARAQHVNQMLNAIEAAVTEVSQTLKRMASNDLSQQASGDFVGIFAELCRLANEAQDRVRNAVRILSNIAAGDFRKDLTDLATIDKRSAHDTLVPAFVATMEAITSLTEEMRRMAQQHDLGDIDAAIDAGKFHGIYHDVAKGINDMVAGHIAVKKKAMACIAELGKGNL